ncbi:RNA polymerase sigma-70 factor [Parapedobacter pyrenivorans]|uniref:RNA polymerase sigma-70 factor n=1 Tax=Parapedobacter pyrenivorans TaxID=1305674 RepID=A0A917HHH7_9SPHI|nr:RNA polymerase sigma-70 factor [Parapedobacter pyrenivorans]GGG79141.1 RNA polymerase sigma-70 factor [Parapedobacter pyrenivorans]
MAIRIEVSNALISQLQQGDETAFRAIYDQLHERVYRMLRALVKNHEQTEDILQQTFVNLWVNRAKLNESQPLYPYIYLTARRLAIDHFRKKINEADALSYLKQHVGEQHDCISESFAAADLQRFTEAVIKTLPRQQRTAFLLSRNEGLSYDEIAERMQISKNTVKNHLIGALKQLKRHFVENDILYVYFLFFLS